MVVELENVVPFGRSLDEYRCLFNLTAEDLDKTIIGIGDGPASFNAEMKANGRSGKHHMTGYGPIILKKSVEYSVIIFGN